MMRSTSSWKPLEGLFAATVDRQSRQQSQPKPDRCCEHVQRDEGLVAPEDAALRVDAAEELAQELHALEVDVVAAQLERGERAVAFQLVAQGRDQARSSVVGHVETREGGRHLGDALDGVGPVDNEA